MDIRNKNTLLNYLNGTLSKRDRIKFDHLLKDDPELSELISRFQNRVYIQKSIKKYSEFDSYNAWNNIVIHGFATNTYNKNKILSIGKYVASVAAVLLILFLIGNLLITRPNKSEINTLLSLTDIAPKTFETQLLLTDHTLITLAVNNDTSMTDQNAGIEMNIEDLNLMYLVDGNINNSSLKDRRSKKDYFHIIRTGSQQEFKLTLADGTIVWLNSSTILRYPVGSSIEKSRSVELIGEAFFQVKKNNEIPFIVNTEKQRVTVTGTSFSISSYPDNDEVKTILLDGEVVIEPLLFEYKPFTLKPDQQSILREDNCIVEAVNASLLTSWRFNAFVFENETLESVSKKLSRWYEVNFLFPDTTLLNYHFTGAIPKYESIDSALNLLQFTKKINFEFVTSKDIRVVSELEIQ